MEPGRIARCVEEENGVAQYLRDALRRLPPDARARCVGAVDRADQAPLEASASYYQALTVYCGAALARAPAGP